jgi:hypothetical protein
MSVLVEEAVKTVLAATQDDAAPLATVLTQLDATLPEPSARAAPTRLLLALSLRGEPTWSERFAAHTGRERPQWPSRGGSSTHVTPVPVELSSAASAPPLPAPVPAPAPAPRGGAGLRMLSRLHSLPYSASAPGPSTANSAGLSVAASGPMGADDASSSGADAPGSIASAIEEDCRVVAYESHGRVSSSRQAIPSNRSRRTKRAASRSGGPPG